MTDVGTYFIAAVFLGLAAWRYTIEGGGRPDALRGPLYGFSVCLGVAFATLAPSTIAALTHLLPTPRLKSLPTLLADELKVSAVAFLALLTLALRALPARPNCGENRDHALAAVGVQLTLALLFLGSGASLHGSSLKVHGAGVPLLAAFNLLFTGYILWVLAVLAKTLVMHARAAEPGAIRLGLVFAAASTIFGMVWMSWTVDDITQVVTKGRQDSGEDILSAVMGALCVILLVGAATAAAWGMIDPLRWLRAHRTHRALEPLWRAVHTALPELALPSPRTGRRFDPEHAELALYRRVIEIRDGHLALRPYVHPDVPLWTAEALTHPPSPQLLEAAALAAALEAHQTGRRHPAPPADVAYPANPTVTAEISWLLQVTQAFTSSPAIPYVRQRASAAAHASP